MFYSGAAYRFLLRSLGWAHLLAGLLVLGLSAVAGQVWPVGIAVGGLLALPGTVMALGRYTPRFMAHPSGVLSGLGAVLAVSILTLAGCGAAMLVAMSIGGGLVPLIALPFGLWALYSGTFILPISAAMIHAGEERALRMQDAAIIAADPAFLAAKSRVATAVEWLLLRLSGIVLLGASTQLVLWYLAGDARLFDLLPADRKLPLFLAALVIPAAACALPLPVGRGMVFWFPVRAQTAIAKVAFAIPAVAAALWWLLPVWTSIVAHPAVATLVANRLPIALTFATVSATMVLLNFFRGTPPAAMAASDDLPARNHIAEIAGPIQKDRRRHPDPKLPAIGAAMKLYVVADWFVLRLLGLGLMGAAWMIWGMVRNGFRQLPLERISYGQDPMHVVYAYAVMGTLLAMPFLLPRFLTSPRTVLGGLAKSVLLVIAALVLLPMLYQAIDELTPDIYHATLHATAPKLFKAVTGIAVTSSLLIAFFRQLGGGPKADRADRPVTVLSPEDLRALRAARMDG